MGLISGVRRILGVKQEWIDDAAKQRRLYLKNGGAWTSFFGRESAAGKIVTLDSTLQLSAAWACVRTNAQAAGSMPLGFYTKTADGSREGFEPKSLAPGLLSSPNPVQTGVEFWETMAAWVMAVGNAYARRHTTGPVISMLEPMNADCVKVKRENGELVYDWFHDGGTERLTAKDVFHVRGFGLGGETGMSPIRYGVQAFGNAMAQDESAGKTFGNGIQAAGILSSDQILKKDQREELQKVMANYVGSTNAGKMMILEAGLKYEQLSLNPEDAQLLETRRFSIEEICRWFGVPPVVIGHSSQGQTMWGTGIEQIMLAWLTLGLNPYLRRVEAAISKQLLGASERGRVYAEFNREGLLQADSAAKMQFLSGAVQNGLMTRNEAREKLNYPRHDGPGADTLTAQSNLAPLDKLGSSPASQQLRAALRTFLSSGEDQ